MLLHAGELSVGSVGLPDCQLFKQVVIQLARGVPCKRGKPPPACRLATIHTENQTFEALHRVTPEEAHHLPELLYE